MSRVLALALSSAAGLLIALGLALGPVDAQPPGPPYTVYLPLADSHVPLVRVSALYYDTRASNEPDEAFQLWNVSAHAVDLAGYAVDDGRRSVVFPSLVLAPGTSLWCAGTATDFARSFGIAPGCEYAEDSDPAIPNLAGTALRFANSGGQVRLLDPQGRPMDVLVYEEGDAGQAGWQGPALAPYTPNTSFPAEGQILYRKRDWRTGHPLPDTDTRGDWAQDPADSLLGRRVQYPGWNLDRFSQPPVIAASGGLTVALAPDASFDLVRQTLAGARHSIRLAAYTFEHVALAETLAAQARQGITVTLLLEGGPVGGITDQQRYALALIEQAGGQAWYLADDGSGLGERYTYQHAKFAVVDERQLLVSTENFAPEAMPDDDKSDGTLGRRGAVLVSDDPDLVAQALAIFHDDLDPAHHPDLKRWAEGDPVHGEPPPGFEPWRESGGTGYLPVQPAPLAVHRTYTAQLTSAPEAALLPPAAGGLLGLVGRAGAGDTVLVEMLYERVHWGSANDTPESAPNPRLDAYLDAARRGAQVRVLLDGFFDHGENAQAAAYLNQVAAREGLDLAARLGNPTGLGIHNKMILVFDDGQGWACLGSLNGSEASARLSRELSLQVQSNPVYHYLAAAFWHDW